MCAVRVEAMANSASVEVNTERTGRDVRSGGTDGTDTPSPPRAAAQVKPLGDRGVEATDATSDRLTITVDDADHDQTQATVTITGTDLVSVQTNDNQQLARFCT